MQGKKIYIYNMKNQSRQNFLIKPVKKINQQKILKKNKIDM